MRKWLFARHWRGEQRGISLIETLIALGILSLIGVAFMNALATGTRATGTLDEQVQAEALARSQQETIANAPYNSTTYDDVKIATPPDFSLTIQVVENKCGLYTYISAPPSIQEVTVAISRTGSGKPLLRVASCKTRP